VRGYLGQEAEADIVWQVDNKYDIGAVRQPDGTYTLVADWWGVDKTVKDLQRKILQQYNVQNVLRRAKLMGHQVKQESQPDGSIHLVVKH